jgi:adenylylsulfate kinase-like enzyme
LFADSSTIAITAFISPYRADRQRARELHETVHKGDDSIPFIEVHVDVPLEVAEQRDPKGLYKKARAGQISDFTGISAPYEEPSDPEIRLCTHDSTVEQCVARIISWLSQHGLLSTPGKADI